MTDDNLMCSGTRAEFKRNPVTIIIAYRSQKEVAPIPGTFRKLDTVHGGQVNRLAERSWPHTQIGPIILSD